MGRSSGGDSLYRFMQTPAAEDVVVAAMRRRHERMTEPKARRLGLQESIPLH